MGNVLRNFGLAAVMLAGGAGAKAQEANAYSFVPQPSPDVGFAIGNCQFDVEATGRGKPIRILAECRETRTDKHMWMRSLQAWTLPGVPAPEGYRRVGDVPELGLGSKFRYAVNMGQVNLYTNAKIGNDDPDRTPGKIFTTMPSVNWDFGYPFHLVATVGFYKQLNSGEYAEMSQGSCNVENDPDRGVVWMFQDGSRKAGCGSMSDGRMEPLTITQFPALNP